MTPSRLRAILAALAVLFTTAALGQQPLTASLSLLPATTLPGLPVAFLILVSNSSDVPQTVVDGMALRVIPASGESFNATGVAGRTQLSLPHDAVADCGSVHCITVPAGGQKQIYVNYELTLADNEFFADKRLARPGSYSLQIVLYAVGTGDAPNSEVLTNPAHLTIEEPSGIDADAWQYLRTMAASGDMTIHDWVNAGPEVASALRSRFPHSRYIPWVAAYGPAASREEIVSRIDEALATSPVSSLRDNLLWLKGGYLAQCSSDALYGDRDLDKAASFATRARTVYSTLEKVAATDSMRAHALEGLAQLYTASTAKGTLEMLAANDPPAPQKIVPRVECVSPGTGNTFSARFGYSNPNRVLKVLQISNLNEVTPAPRDQGQPRLFKPGDHPNAFTAVSPGGNLIWHVDNNTAVATGDFAIRCSP